MNSNPMLYITPDSKEYLTLADNIISLGQYTTGTEPEVFRAPGYPLFLSFFRFFTQNVFWVALFQAGIDTLNCFLVWLLARKLFAIRLIAHIALLLQALSVSSIVYSTQILSETLFTLF